MVPHTRYAILGLLARGPGYGYELAARFGELVGPGWQLNRGQVYDMCHTLEKAGLVEVLPGPRGPRGVKRYRINEKGEEAYVGWLGEPCHEAQPHRHALYLKLVLARPQDAPHLLESIARREQDCLDRLRNYADGVSHSPAHATDWELLAREMIDEATTTHLHAELEWLGKMRKRIDTHLERLQGSAGQRSASAAPDAGFRQARAVA